MDILLWEVYVLHMITCTCKCIPINTCTLNRIYQIVYRLIHIAHMSAFICMYVYTKGFTDKIVYVHTAAGCRHNQQKNFIFWPILDFLKTYNYAPIYIGMCVYILHIKLYVHSIK